MQNGVILTHTVVHGRAVLQVVFVAVGFNLLPAFSHKGSPDRVVIFRIKVIVVILVVDLFHVAAELLKGLYFAGVGSERQAHLAERVVSLESGENKSVVFKGMAHRFRHLIRDAGGNGAVNLLESLCDEAARFGVESCDASKPPAL